MPLEQAVRAVGHPQRAIDILLDEHDGGPLAGDLTDDAVQRLDHEGSQTEGGLVEQEQARVAHQGAADRKRLLLAA
jgi:hypothetical protein